MASAPAQSELAQILQFMQQQQQQQHQHQMQLIQQLATGQEKQLQAQLAVSATRGEHAPAPFTPFLPQVESWADYVERLEQHWIYYGVESEERKRAAFLSTVGIETNSLLKKLCSDKEICKLPWSEIKETLDKYYEKGRMW